MLLHWLCVTSSTFISRSCGSRLVSERIVNGFPCEMCQAVPFWFTLTGCDSASMFAGRGKKTTRSAWQKYSEATQYFKR